MKNLTGFVALLALTACATADGNRAAGQTANLGCTRIAWTEAGKPIIRGSINGRELTFLVDTGAEYDGWIKPEIAEELGLPIVGTVPSEGDDDTTGGLPFFGADSVQLGTINLTGRHFAEMPQVGQKPQPFDGVIGNGLFAGMQTAFDYQRGQLLLTDESLNTGDVVPFDQYNIPLLTLMVGDQPVEVNLDTGNLASKLFVTEAAAETLRILGEPIKKGRAMTVSGAFDVMEGNLAEPVRFGSTTLAITTVRWPGAYDGGQIGSQGLSGQTLRIDWRSKRVSIMPEATGPACAGS